ncbi:hypothetical protein BGZ58_000167 [Dissophora ornata]|nr:hypothetical protein BGZ58_000167 [Dissophora ornata]
MEECDRVGTKAHEEENPVSLESAAIPAPTLRPRYAEPSTPFSPSKSPSSPSQTVSSSVLSPETLARMRAEFFTNFKEYDGEPWLLSTDINVNEALFQYTMMLETESLSHSFVLDKTKAALQCFAEQDQHIFHIFVNACDSRLPETLITEWMQEEVWKVFLKLLVSGGRLLKYEASEVPSIASSLSKNRNCELDSRPAQGRKMDGLITRGEAQREIRAAEMGK